MSKAGIIGILLGMLFATVVAVALIFTESVPFVEYQYERPEEMELFVDLYETSDEYIFDLDDEITEGFMPGSNYAYFTMVDTDDHQIILIVGEGSATFMMELSYSPHRIRNRMDIWVEDILFMDDNGDNFFYEAWGQTFSDGEDYVTFEGDIDDFVEVLEKLEPIDFIEFGRDIYRGGSNSAGIFIQPRRI